MTTPSATTVELDRHYRRNVVGISGVEFLWGLGLPLVLESTFLQLFLKSLGASSFAVGLIPFFFFVGSSIFALLSSYFTSNMTFKRTAVVLLHMVSGGSMLLFGVFLLFWGKSAGILVIFFACYAVFSICIGMTLPVWLNYLVSIFTEKNAVSGLGYMMVAQNAARLVCSLFIVRLVDQYAFSTLSSAVTFIGVGGLFTIGSLLFLMTRESSSASVAPAAARPPLAAYIRDTFRHIMANRNFLWFLAGDMDFYVVVTVVSFYATYATGFCGIDPAMAAGAFVGCIYTGAICANLLMGTLDLFTLKQKYLVSKTCSLAAVTLLALFTSPAGFYGASVLLGAARGTRMITMTPSVKKLSGLPDATGYFAVAPLFTLPFATALPLVCGAFLDRFPHLGGDAYRLTFFAAGVLIAATLYCILRTRFSGIQPPVSPPRQP